MKKLRISNSNKLVSLMAIVFVWMGNMSIYAQQSIIPKPVEVSSGIGYFTITRHTNIISGPSTGNEADYLSAILENALDESPKEDGQKSSIQLELNPLLQDQIGDEGYILEISLSGIHIAATKSAGLFYGIQSLLQLMPPEVLEPAKSNAFAEISVPVIKIVDYPKFTWRAFMLDESRHFKGKETVKRLLDQMALLKMNVFHWHLTDDQGWRIEIKKYPRLTEVGAFRKDTQASRRSEKRLGHPHGGFYTQEEIKEIITYAAKRHIKIIPEIEMPGHAMAAIAAYPWLGVIGKTQEVPVVFGKLDDSFNIADERVYHFLTDVLKEVFDLFPEKIVHIGGDEVMFDAWDESKQIQKKIKKEGLASSADLQVHFTNQISSFMESKGHRMMGWNEILGFNVHEWQDDDEIKVEQKLSSNAIIHFWKGNPELIKEAISRGHDVVNSYHSYTYLDYDYQSIPVAKAYSFNPIPEGLPTDSSKKILGLGCQMWSEWIPTVRQMDEKVFPRLAAYAEVGWTLPENKNFRSFSNRLVQLKEYWKASGIDYNETE